MNTYHFDSFIAIPWFIAIPLTALLILKCFELLLRVVKYLDNMPYSHEDDSNEKQDIPIERDEDICFADASRKHLWGQYDSGRSQRCANCHLIWDSLTDGLMTLEEYENKYYTPSDNPK